MTSLRTVGKLNFGRSRSKRINAATKPKSDCPIRTPSGDISISKPAAHNICHACATSDMRRYVQFFVNTIFPPLRVWNHSTENAISAMIRVLRSVLPSNRKYPATIIMSTEDCAYGASTLIFSFWYAKDQKFTTICRNTATPTRSAMFL